MTLPAKESDIMQHVKHRNGKVAVLISRGYGAGWSTWNSDCPECLYHPDIVKLVRQWQKQIAFPTYDDKQGLEAVVTPVAKELFGEEFCALGANGLDIEWLAPGTLFQIEEYDGAESLRIYSPAHYHVVPGA